ncbi:transcriptional regulator [Bombilactobacillus bombi]|uniref:Transcriptional regulator n=1 Tax=Bombilactobacillus bombi TaxID=1303590 RepID=A0A417ZHV0_9LACO|nr:helix-turn-helix transcriptional regulator [Bombilactobacillus bombi]RHW51289.1 transcriptional regulator [Bombilactobacillus bombi]
MTTGERIAKLRLEHGYSQPKLAEKMSVSQSTVAMWESNKRNVSNQDLVRLSKLFNVSTDYLLGNTNKKHYYDLTEQERIDLGKLADRMLEGTTNEAEADFWGEPSTQEQKNNLRAAILTALEINKTQAKKDFTPKKYRNKDNKSNN